MCVVIFLFVYHPWVVWGKNAGPQEGSSSRAPYVLSTSYEVVRVSLSYWPRQSQVGYVATSVVDAV